MNGDHYLHRWLISSLFTILNSKMLWRTQWLQKIYIVRTSFKTYILHFLIKIDLEKLIYSLNEYGLNTYYVSNPYRDTTLRKRTHNPCHLHSSRERKTSKIYGRSDTSECYTEIYLIIKLKWYWHVFKDQARNKCKMLLHSFYCPKMIEITELFLHSSHTKADMLHLVPTT